IIEWDVKNYYAYLPAAFIYNDLHQKYFDTIPELQEYAWYSLDDMGNRYLKVSMGVAMMYLPSFIIVHTWQLLNNGDTGGYGVPYQRAIALNVLLFLYLGLFVLYKLLLKYFKPFIAYLTIIVIIFATNMLYYATNEPGLTHIYSFCLFSVFIWAVDKWHENPNIKTALAIGLLMGFITIIRPTNAIIIVLLFLYNVKSFSDLKKNMLLAYKYRLQWVLAVLISCLPWLPQIIYWKIATGHFIFYSYGVERFFFTQPEIINVLFSYRKGWFVYTPIALIALIGIIFLKNKLSSYRWPVIIYIVLQIYIVSSWWDWWYGGCFGQRSMIESFALLAIPLAAFVNFIFKKFSWQKLSLGIIIILLLTLNIIQTFQYRYTIIHWDSMTKEAYWHVFLKLDKPKDIDRYLVEPDYDKQRKGR
ncbi:MAG: hypothetical protein PHT69_12395, partial [Bacteroidales bacterium]|nr:hypothetical protein [Bacteroidales bacterium]